MPAPRTTLDRRYSDPDATPTTWEVATGILDTAEIFWLSSVRPEGGPHITPVIAIWMDEALWFATGAREQKARNLAHQPRVALTTGCNAYAEGLDIVVEGIATPSHDHATLQRLADRYAIKYDWHFTVSNGALIGDGVHPAEVFRVQPEVAYGFARGTSGHTRWTF